MRKIFSFDQEGTFGQKIHPAYDIHHGGFSSAIPYLLFRNCLLQNGFLFPKSLLLYHLLYHLSANFSSRIIKNLKTLAMFQMHKKEEGMDSERIGSFGSFLIEINLDKRESKCYNKRA